MRAPAFWYIGHRTTASLVLMPLGWLYGLAGQLKDQVTTGHKAPLPVICIGNFVAGGAGKTPVALAIAALLQRQQKAVGFLTRGYGGKLTGPVSVAPDQHSAQDVGDEALLLAQACPTIVAANRCAGADELSRCDVEIIVMDDGFQNPSLHKDLCLIVIDHQQGIGNGRVIPAGPLRNSLDYQISKAHGFIIVGGELNDQNLKLRLHKSGKPIFTAHLEPADDTPDLSGKKVIAYTGIGMPDKFFATLEKAGAKIIERIRFPDHHRFSQSDAQWLLDLQDDHRESTLVTTAKDHIRLKGTAEACARLYRTSLPYGVELKFDHEKLLMDFILKTV
jgi:tetraacyldisaccharide 4'-kinase